MWRASVCITILLFFEPVSMRVFMKSRILCVFIFLATVAFLTAQASAKRTLHWISYSAEAPSAPGRYLMQIDARGNVVRAPVRVLKMGSIPGGATASGALGFAGETRSHIALWMHSF